MSGRFMKCEKNTRDFSHECSFRRYECLKSGQELMFVLFFLGCYTSREGGET